MDRVARRRRLSPRVSHRAHGHGVADIVERIRARLTWWQLDQALAAGGDPHQPRLRMRATTLTRRRTLESIASRLESAVAEAESRPPDSLSAAIPVRREAVRDARPLMLSLALALREPGRVSPQGIARAELLVKDGGSPLYWNGGRDLLVELRSAIAALDLAPRKDDGGG